MVILPRSGVGGGGGGGGGGGVKWLFMGIFRKLSLCKMLWIIR